MRLINPTNPVPPLIGVGTPVDLYALICSNDEHGEGPPYFLKCLRRVIYKNFGKECEPLQALCKGHRAGLRCVKMFFKDFT